jgi:hypothetical protein
MKIEPRQDAIDSLYTHLREQQSGARMTAEPSSNGTGPSPSADDEIIIQKALAAKNGTKVAKLWSGDTSEHGFQNADGTWNEGRSEADLALCRELAYWTQNREQIDRSNRTNVPKPS